MHHAVCNDFEYKLRNALIKILYVTSVFFSEFWTLFRK